MRYPVELHDRGDGYAHHGTDADGKGVEFEDLVGPGDSVGQTSRGCQDDVFPPFGRVVARDGDLYIDHDEEADRKHDAEIKQWIAEHRSGVAHAARP